jgi:hypothetical protein
VVVVRVAVCRRVRLNSGAVMVQPVCGGASCVTWRGVTKRLSTARRDEAASTVVEARRRKDTARWNSANEHPSPLIAPTTPAVGICERSTRRVTTAKRTTEKG